VHVSLLAAAAAAAVLPVGVDSLLVVTCKNQENNTNIKLKFLNAIQYIEYRAVLY